MNKTCTKCKLPKNLDEFEVRPRNKDGRSGRCTDCRNRYMREYYASNEGARLARAEYLRNLRNQFKDKVFEYFGARCACCGETCKTFLTLDHKDNDGAEHRRQLNTSKNGRASSTDKTWRWLVKTNFAEADRFQILCYNCNCGKRDNGGVCPHQE